MIGNSELQERMAEQMEFVVSQTPEALAAENAKLREQVDAAHMSRLLTENENEKLRELVMDMVDYGEGAGNGMAEFFAD